MMLRIRHFFFKRCYSTPAITRSRSKRKSLLSQGFLGPLQNDLQTEPTRTRFAPSPTGFLHLGSLRTALYNYLWAKATGGSFLLRLEDTDQKRLVEGAEEDIYASLRWAGLDWDEGPDSVGGVYGPYRQSDRLDIYRKYAQELIDGGLAYRCFCSADRLNNLRETASQLSPPSLATYDRFCCHMNDLESRKKAHDGEPYTIRLKAPEKYPIMSDLLHGDVDIQVQKNYNDMRFDDPVLLKSDGFPTYHLANVVDDHLMKITHVIRGEEWMASTPKHLALYEAFGWEPPKFVHIPLLTSDGSKKLSKRSGDTGIKHYASIGILPEALINFVVLYGWAPESLHSGGKMRRTQTVKSATGEVMSISDIISQFSINGLTKGNTAISESKLFFFNSQHLRLRINDDEQCSKLAESVRPLLRKEFSNIVDLKSYRLSQVYIISILRLFKGSLQTLPTLPRIARCAFLDELKYDTKEAIEYLESLSKGDENNVQFAINLLTSFRNWWISGNGHRTTENRSATIKLENVYSQIEMKDEIKQIANAECCKPADLYHALRFAVSESLPGAPLIELLEVLDTSLVTDRLSHALRILTLKL
ncbi:tRNA synthetases class I, catalytic domain-containing protein [Lipomyces oligophaga]|uniref:tRNA synthetases class I, catalytic domain-containing protein n=1 Tax=Lipomyces oligophaga TaxID=45792 RepID=UPI0034CFDA77